MLFKTCQWTWVYVSFHTLKVVKASALLPASNTTAIVAWFLHRYVVDSEDYLGFSTESSTAQGWRVDGPLISSTLPACWRFTTCTLPTTLHCNWGANDLPSCHREREKRQVSLLIDTYATILLRMDPLAKTKCSEICYKIWHFLGHWTIQWICCRGTVL